MIKIIMSSPGRSSLAILGLCLLSSHSLGLNSVTQISQVFSERSTGLAFESFKSPMCDRYPFTSAFPNVFNRTDLDSNLKVTTFKYTPLGAEDLHNNSDIGEGKPSSTSSASISSDGIGGEYGFVRKECFPHPDADVLETEQFCIFVNLEGNNGQGMVIIARPSSIHDTFRESTVSLRESMTETGDRTMKVVDMPEKGGKGALARRRIEIGDTVISARATIMTSVESETWGRSDWKAIKRKAFESLPSQTQLEIWEMHGLGEQLEDRLSSIIDLNSFEIKLGSKQDIPFFALMIKPARLNHDCRPNAGFYIDNEKFQVHMKALRIIEVGEELTISYRDMSLSRSERQKEIAHYGFQCTCPHCSMSEELVEASDGRIRLLEQLRANISEWDSSDYRAEATEMVELFEMEKLWNTISGGYSLASIVYNSYGQISQARSYATKAMFYGLITEGPNWLERDAVQEIIDSPQTHWSYNSHNSQPE